MELLTIAVFLPFFFRFQFDIYISFEIGTRQRRNVKTERGSQISSTRKDNETDSSPPPPKNKKRNTVLKSTTMNEDQKAKEKARQARKAGLAVASQRETAEDATARLDERISGQRSAAKDAKERAKRSSDPSSGLKELARMEADATAKARVRPSGGPAVRPGAFYVEETSAPPAAPEELSQMESDVMSKSRARPTASPSVADSSDIHSEIAQLEAQATGRSRRDEGRAKTDLNQLEADVAAKTRARGSAQTSSTVYQLSKLESDVMAKARVRPDHSGATKPGAQEARSVEDAMTNTGRTEPSDARNELNQLEADVARKQSARSSTQVSHPGVSNVRDLDERIAYKTGIPLNNEEKEQNPAEEETSSDQIHNVSKITGISPATVSEALEKTRALYQGADLSILENKLDGYQTSTGERYHDLEAGDEEDGKLAVAIAVNQDDEDKFIPAAVEYDPDSKPPLYKNRRFRLYSLLAFSLLSSVVIAGLVAILVRDDDPQKVVPTNERWNIGIQELLEKVVGNENLSDKSSSHYSALEWIIEEDPMQLTPDDDHLIQRYLLAHFYFDTHQEGNWLSCERQNQSDRDETCVFKRLKSVFPLEYNDVIMFRWLSLMHECEWAGIFCDDFEQVRAIDLTAQVIQGTLPVELSHLSFLQGISLGWNEFEGTIPSEYGNIKQLLELELHYNSLTGTIPSWPEARNLQLLNLGSNHLTGSLPSDMRYLSNLEGLYLNENGLTGTFPEEFAELSSLGEFFLLTLFVHNRR